MKKFNRFVMNVWKILEGMKSPVFVMLIIGLLLAAPVAAQLTPQPLKEDPNAATQIDSKIKRLWSGLTAAENFHFFDNGTAAYFFDVNHGERMSGVSTSIWSRWYISADVAVIKTIEADRSGFPAIGASLQVDEIVLKIPYVKDVTRYVGAKAPLLKYTRVGAWYGRDYNAHVHRYGYYVGLGRRFTGLGELLGRKPEE